MDALVLEAAREIRPLGVGINIQSAAVGELIWLGLGDVLAATAIATAEHRYLDQHGTRLWSQPRGQAAGAEFPQYSVHRGEPQMLLADAVRERLGPQSIRTGTHVRGVHGTGDRAHVQALDEVSNAEVTIEAVVVVAADGLHSAVLAQLHPGQVQLWDAGVGMWRGVCELDEFLDGHTLIMANDDRGARLVADPISARHAARGRALVNWVCLVPTGTPGPVRGDADWNRPARLEEVAPHCAVGLRLAAGGRHARGGERDLLLPDGRSRPAAVLGTRPDHAARRRRASDVSGRWQRASQAILGAAALADALSSAGDLPAALRHYEASRRPATTALVDASREMDRAERAAVTKPGPDKGTALAAIAGNYDHAVATATHAIATTQPQDPSRRRGG
jgi:2-polyprenyl-6-methoxyphenol hydroxylase-like FAD-dependent oxidoreductase